MEPLEVNQISTTPPPSAPPATAKAKDQISTTAEKALKSSGNQSTGQELKNVKLSGKAKTPIILNSEQVATEILKTKDENPEALGAKSARNVELKDEKTIKEKLAKLGDQSDTVLSRKHYALDRSMRIFKVADNQFQVYYKVHENKQKDASKPSPKTLGVGATSKVKTVVDITGEKVAVRKPVSANRPGSKTEELNERNINNEINTAVNRANIGQIFAMKGPISYQRLYEGKTAGKLIATTQQKVKDGEITREQGGKIAVSMIRQAIASYEQLASIGVLPADAKVDNFVLDEDPFVADAKHPEEHITMVMIDQGASIFAKKPVGDEMETLTLRGTPYYMAPEMGGVEMIEPKYVRSQILKGYDTAIAETRRDLTKTIISESDRKELLQKRRELVTQREAMVKLLNEIEQEAKDPVIAHRAEKIQARMNKADTASRRKRMAKKLYEKAVIYPLGIVAFQAITGQDPVFTKELKNSATTMSKGAMDGFLVATRGIYMNRDYNGLNQELSASIKSQMTAFLDPNNYPGVPLEVRQLVYDCLSPDPAKRPSLEQLTAAMDKLQK